MDPRGRVFLPVLALALALAAAGSAGAVSDPRDAAGKLDIASATLTRSGASLVGTIAMHGAWRSTDLRPSASAPACFLLWARSPTTGGPNYTVCADQTPMGQLVGNVYRTRVEGPVRIARARVARPNARTVRLVWARRLVGGGGASLRWQARTFDKRFDVAPRTPARLGR